MRVAARDGRQWTVRRHWSPRLGSETMWARARRRFRLSWRRRDAGDAADVADVADAGCMLDIADELVFVVVVLAVVAFLFFIGVPLLLALIDLVLLVLLTLLGVLARVLLRRPWTVEASTEAQRIEWRVVGLRRSGELVRDIAQRLESGQPLPSTAGGSGPVI